MRPVSSRLMIAVGFAALALAGTDVSAAPGGGHPAGGYGSSGHVAGPARAGPGGFHSLEIRTTGRGYGAGDLGRAGLGRGYGSGDRGGFERHGYGRRHGRFGDLELGFGGFGYGYGPGLAYGGQGYGESGDGPKCCFSGSAYPMASGIRAAPVEPPAVYVIGENRSGRHGNLRRGIRGAPLEADSSMAGRPSGIVTPGGARIIHVP